MDIFEEMITVGSRVSDSGMEITGLMAASLTYFWMGDFALARRPDHPFNLCFALYTGGTFYGMRREPAEHLKRMDEVFRIGVEHSMAVILNVIGFYGEPPRSSNRANQNGAWRKQRP
ncbi:MAG: hypothetical protein O7C66_03320 [Alphaproteobacteria bacterium]|nr:hypothetical protein [Alphaproteobacteria bacterium]